MNRETKLTEKDIRTLRNAISADERNMPISGHRAHLARLWRSGLLIFDGYGVHPKTGREICMYKISNKGRRAVEIHDK